MGSKVLADKKHKLTILTTKPADEAAPTATELNAGIEACMKVYSDGFEFTAADSATVNAKMLCGSNEEVYTDENFTFNMTVARFFLDAGGVDPADDELFEALKERGTTLWAYARLTDKVATDDWEADDEIYLGARFTTDHPQLPTNSGWVAFRVPAKVQEGWPFITVAAA